MRLYMGVSKKIKAKTLLKWVATIFFLVLTTLCLQKVNAETIPIGDGATTISYGGTDVYDMNNSSQVVTYSNSYMNKNTTNDYYVRLSVCTSNCGSDSFNAQYMYLGTSQGAINYNDSFRYVLYATKFFYTPTSTLCPNDSNDLKSLNFRFMIDSPSYGDWYYSKARFGLDDNYNTTLEGFKYKGLNVRTLSHVTKDSTEYLFSTSCIITESNYTGGTQFKGNLVTCNNVFSGNSEYVVDYYIFEIGNGMPFSNIYTSSTNGIDVLSTYVTLGVPKSTSYQSYAIFDYECTDNEPVINEPLPEQGVTNVLGDIWSVINNGLGQSLQGLNNDDIFLNYPTRFEDILLMPLSILNALTEVSEDSCTPYEINLSGISQSLGHGNSYTLTLPCMRSLLSQKLGTLYTLIDVLLCAIVFYNVFMNAIQLIEAITSGEDLYTYFFQRTNQVNNTGYGHYNKQTGEVVD